MNRSEDSFKFVSFRFSPLQTNFVQIPITSSIGQTHPFPFLPPLCHLLWSPFFFKKKKRTTLRGEEVSWECTSSRSRRELHSPRRLSQCLSLLIIVILIFYPCKVQFFFFRFKKSTWKYSICNSRHDTQIAFSISSSLFYISYN